MKFDDFFKIIVETDLKWGNIPMLLGGPGIGKSSWVKWFAGEIGTKSFSLACNQLGDKADLTGARLLPVLDKDGNETGDWEQKFFPHQTISRAIKYALENKSETPILFLDEINRTTADITSALLSLATDRTIGNVELPDNLRIMIAGNDKGNITMLDTASISRFVLYYMKPCLETFLKWNPNLNIFVKNTVVKNPELIYEDRPVVTQSEDSDEEFDINMLDDADQMLQITTPRTIAYMSDFLNEIPQDVLISSLTLSDDGVSAIEELITGHVGKTNFAMLLTQEIVQNVMTVNTNQNAPTLVVTKPKCFDELKAVATVKDLEEKLMDLSVREQSMVLAYALQDTADHSNLLNVLSTVMTEIDIDAKKKIMTLSANDQIDEDNLRAFMVAKNSVTDTINIIAGNLV
jgi:moxR-like ATPase